MGNFLYFNSLDTQGIKMKSHEIESDFLEEVSLYPTSIKRGAVE